MTSMSKEELKTAEEWIRCFGTKQEKISDKSYTYTYSMKHSAERWGEETGRSGYVPSVAIVKAASNLGYDTDDYEDHFNIVLPKKKSYLMFRSGIDRLAFRKLYDTVNFTVADGQSSYLELLSCKIWLGTFCRIKDSMNRKCDLNDIVHLIKTWTEADLPNPLLEPLTITPNLVMQAMIDIGYRTNYKFPYVMSYDEGGVNKFNISVTRTGVSHFNLRNIANDMSRRR